MPTIRRSSVFVLKSQSIKAVDQRRDKHQLNDFKLLPILQGTVPNQAKFLVRGFCYPCSMHESSIKRFVPGN